MLLTLVKSRYQLVNNILKHLIGSDVQQGFAFVNLGIADRTVLAVLQVLDNATFTNCKINIEMSDRMSDGRYMGNKE